MLIQTCMSFLQKEKFRRMLVAIDFH